MKNKEKTKQNKKQEKREKIERRKKTWPFCREESLEKGGASYTDVAAASERAIMASLASPSSVTPGGRIVCFTTWGFLCGAGMDWVGRTAGVAATTVDPMGTWATAETGGTPKGMEAE